MQGETICVEKQTRALKKKIIVFYTEIATQKDDLQIFTCLLMKK